MANKGQDLTRARRLTAAQAARYDKIRRQVMEEIPPVECNVVCQTIGKLRQLRQDQGLSLAALQKRTGMTRANLCRLEKEKRNVQLRTLERYARALGCRLEVHLVPMAAKAKVAQG